MRFTISEKLKTRINRFIKDNDIRLSVTDNGMSPYGLVTPDRKLVIYPVEHDSGLYMLKYEPKKDKVDQRPYEWSSVMSEQQFLLEIKELGTDLTYQPYMLIQDISKIVTDLSKYMIDWYKNAGVSNRWEPKELDGVVILVLDDPDTKPELVSPYESLCMVSPLNTSKTIHRPGKLYVEIEPIDCESGTYLARMLMTDDPILPEYIKWYIPDTTGLTVFAREVEGQFYGH